MSHFFNATSVLSFFQRGISLLCECSTSRLARDANRRITFWHRVGVFSLRPAGESVEFQEVFGLNIKLFGLICWGFLGRLYIEVCKRLHAEISSAPLEFTSRNAKPQAHKSRATPHTKVKNKGTGKEKVQRSQSCFKGFKEVLLTDYLSYAAHYLHAAPRNFTFIWTSTQSFVDYWLQKLEVAIDKLFPVHDVASSTEAVLNA